MRISVIIVIIFLITLFPVTVYGQNGTPGSLSQSYYFSSQEPGSFPANSSTFFFSESGNIEAVSANIGNQLFGNGLGVTTCNLSAPGFVKIKTPDYHDYYTFNMSFSWNNSINCGLAENDIIISYGSRVILNVSFGPELGYYIFSYNSMKQKIAADPEINHLCNMSVCYNPALNGSFISFSSTGSGLIFPFFYPSLNGTGSNLSVLVGGEVSYIALYSISISPDPSFQTEKIDRRSESFGIAGYGNDFGRHYESAFYNRQTNSIIGLASGNAIGAFNLYNRSYFNLTRPINLNGNVSVIYANSSSMLSYYIENSTESCIVNIDLDNFSATSMKITGSIDMPIGMLVNDQNYIIFGDGGIFGLIKQGSTSITESYLGANIGAILLSAAQAGNQTDSFWLLNQTLYSINFSDSTGAVSHQSSSMINLNSSYVDSIHLFSSGGLISSIISYNFNSGLVLFSGGSLVPIGKDFASQVNISSLSMSDFLVTNSNIILYSNSSGISEFGNPSASYGFYLPAGNEGFIGFNQTSLSYFYNLDGNEFCGSAPVAVVNASYVLTGENVLNFKIGQNNSLTADLRVGNLSFVNSGETFVINSSILKNGMYKGSLKLQAFSGFSSVYNFTVFVDTGTPELNLNIANGSYISQIFGLRLNFTFWTGIRYVNVSYENHTLDLAGINQTVPLNFGNITGNVSVRIVMVDDLGISHLYEFNAYVIPSNVSNFSFYPSNETYFNSTKPEIYWSPVQYAKYYVITITSDKLNYSIITDNDSLSPTLENGTFQISICAMMLDNSQIKLSSRTFYVMDYAPSISFNRSDGRFFSLYGDSNNNSFYVSAASNVTSDMSFSITGPSKTTIYLVNVENVVQFNSSSNSYLFTSNGNYNFKISSVGESGLESSILFNISINNTIPSPALGSINAIYTNMTALNLNISGQKNVSSTFILYFGGNEVEDISGISAQFTLSMGTGQYVLIANVTSEWGNFRNSSVLVTYETADPVINVSVNTSAGGFVNYRISDPAPLQEVFIQYLTKTVILDPDNTSGVLALNVNRNSVFNASIFAKDRCGNAAELNFGVAIDHYVNITGASFDGYSILGLSLFSIHLSGQNVENATVSISYGRESLGGTTLFDLLTPFGYSEATAYVNYQNTTLIYHKRIFSVSWYPLIAAAFLSAAFFAYGKARENTDDLEITDFVLSCDGMRIKAAIKSAKKRRISGHSIRRSIEALSKEGSIEIGTDPDGKEYIVRKGEN